MPTIQTYPSLELWQAWDEVSLLGTHPVPWRIGPWWLGTDQQTDRALRNKEQTEAAHEQIHPSCHSFGVQRPQVTPAAHPGTHILQTPPVPFPLSACGLPRPSGRCWVHCCQPEQPHTAPGGCCFRLVNHYKMLVMFCLSRGKKKIKYRKKKSGSGLKQLWTWCSREFFLSWLKFPTFEHNHKLGVKTQRR